MPWAPCEISAVLAFSGSNDIFLTWQRRDRLGQQWIASPQPMSEDQELYDVDILDALGTTVLRSINSITTPQYTYSAANQATDGFTPPIAELKVNVYQRSVNMGRGFPGFADILIAPPTSAASQFSTQFGLGVSVAAAVNVTGVSITASPALGVSMAVPSVYNFPLAVAAPALGITMAPALTAISSVAAASPGLGVSMTIFPSILFQAALGAAPGLGVGMAANLFVQSFATTSQGVGFAVTAPGINISHGKKP